MSKNKNNSTEDIVTPPYSLEAERAVLGGLMLDVAGWEKIADKIVEEDFYRYDHRLIFQAISQLANKNNPLDVVTLSEYLNQINQLMEAGGMAYLIELAKNTPSAANIEAYAEIVRERAISRGLLQVSQEIMYSVHSPNGKNTHELLDEAERKIFAIADRGIRDNGPQSIQEALTKMVERVDYLFHNKSAIIGIPTGYVDFDKLTSGLHAGELVVIAGRPSMGKTTLALNIAEHAVLKQDKNVVFFSLEMSTDAVTTRMVSSLGRVDQTRLRNGQLEEEDWPRMTSAVGILNARRNFYIDHVTGITPTDLHARTRRLQRERGPIGLIIIDYLQLMQVPDLNENQTAEISEISRSLKLLATAFNVPVIALSQLNRSLENRPNKRPIMSDLRQSGAIEQDADLIAFVYRDEVYNENSQDKGIAEIIISKQRNGPIGTVRLLFQGEFSRFDNLASPGYLE